MGMYWYKWEPQRWRNSVNVSAMSLAERGGYRELLDFQSMQPNGKIPNRPELFWKFANTTPAEWDAIKGNVLKMFAEVDGGAFLVNDTAYEFWTAAANKCAINAESGRKGGKTTQARAKESAGDPEPDAGAKNPPAKKYTEHEEDAFAKVWAHYISKCERNPVTYSITPERKAKAIARYRECLNKTKGDHGEAVSLMLKAVDGLAASDWNMGRDPKSNGKKYCDFIDHLFKNFMEMEKRWNQGGGKSALRPAGRPLMDRVSEDRRAVMA